MPKIISPLLCLVLMVALGSHAQETITVQSKLPGKMMEIYHVLKADNKIRQGLYQLRYEKTKALASGTYTANHRTGTWHFFNKEELLIQNFDYDRNLLTYEAESDLPNEFDYTFDKSFKATDTLTRPIKIGGYYGGYTQLMGLFKAPKSFTYSNLAVLIATVELLISPAGNLADYSVHVGGLDLNLNINLLDADDKRFVPARLNGDPIASRIIVKTRLDASGNLIFN